MITIVVHIDNGDPIKLDVDEMPKASDNVIIGSNPRERSDKDITWVDDGVTTIIIPWWRINYIQVLPDPTEEMDLPSFYRD